METDRLKLADPPEPGEGAASAAAAAVAPAAPWLRWNWVPIRALAPRHRGRIAAHLLALNESDRYLRFGHVATDTQIGKYVDLLDFDHDDICGIFNRRLDLIAMAHLAYAHAPGDASPAEFGVSIAAAARRRGFGQRLFEHAMLLARNRGVKTLLIHALSENTAMLKIARNLGATIERDGPESQAVVALPADTLASRIDELVGTHAAEIDYQLKRGGWQIDRALGLAQSVREDLRKNARVAEE